MPNVDLCVPFEEKDEAKGLGARWDVERKTWYMPAGKDERIFWRWMPPVQHQIKLLLDAGMIIKGPIVENNQSYLLNPHFDPYRIGILTRTPESDILSLTDETDSLLK